MAKTWHQTDNRPNTCEEPGDGEADKEVAEGEKEDKGGKEGDKYADPPQRRG